MIRNLKLFITPTLLFLIMLGTPVILMAGAPQTDAEIQNYSRENITIEYRMVTIGGKVKWKPIGEISTGTARIFRNLTIGSVIRAKGERVTQEFTISSPPGGENQIVLRVQ
jgi:hypothetical protein